MLLGHVRRSSSRALAAAMATPFPSSPEQLTPSWLTDVLRRSGGISASSHVRCAPLRVAVKRAEASPRRRSSFDATPLGVGVGLASLMQRLRVHVRTGGGGGASTLSLVGKWPPHAGPARDVAARLGSFSREAGFYGAAASDTSPPLPSAVVHFASFEPSSGSACLLFEDLASFTPGDQVAGASPKVASAVVADVASLHARFWGDARLTTDWAPWLPSLGSDTMLSFDAAGFDALWPGFKAQQPAAASRLPPQCLAALDAGCFHGAAAALLARLGAAPATLCHGDLRLDNVMYRQSTRSDGNTEPAEPVQRGASSSGVGTDEFSGLERRYIDLGDCVSGRGAFDVAYFLSMSLPSPLRSAMERPLIADYTARLAAGGVEGYGEVEAWEDYRCGVAYSLALAVGLGGDPHLGVAPKRRQLLAAAVAQRAVDALIGTGAEALLR